MEEFDFFRFQKEGCRNRMYRRVPYNRCQFRTCASRERRHTPSVKAVVSRRHEEVPGEGLPFVKETSRLRELGLAMRGFGDEGTYLVQIFEVFDVGLPSPEIEVSELLAPLSSAKVT
jgi:hypothetical protein